LASRNLADRALERPLPGQRFEQHHADTVPVAGGGRTTTGRVFRRDVGRRAADPLGVVARGGSDVGGEAEVHQLEVPLVGDEHVRRLDVAVEFSFTVQIGEGKTELGHRAPEPRQITRRSGLPEVDRFGIRIGRCPSADIGEEVHAGDQLHRDEPRVFVREQLVEGHQVGMREIRQDAELPS